MSQEPAKNNNTIKLLTIMVVAIAAVIIGYWLLIRIYWIMYGMIFLLIVIPMVINRKLVSRIFSYLKDLYKKNKFLGVLGIIGGVVGFLPFTAFLLGKTILGYVSPNLFKKTEKQTPPIANSSAPTKLDEIMPVELEEPKALEDINLTNDLLKNNNSKFPPTEQ